MTSIRQRNATRTLYIHKSTTYLSNRELQTILLDQELTNNEIRLLTFVLTQHPTFNPTPTFLAKKLQWSQRTVKRILSQLRVKRYYVALHNDRNQGQFAVGEHHFFAQKLEPGVKIVTRQELKDYLKRIEKQENSPMPPGDKTVTRYALPTKRPKNPETSGELNDSTRCQDCHPNSINSSEENRQQQETLSETENTHSVVVVSVPKKLFKVVHFRYFALR